MSAINLLPWREWRRERAKRTFFVSLGLSGAAAITVVLALGWHLDRESHRMDRRNDYLRERIVELDRRIADIEELTDQTEQVLSRLEVARALKGNRQGMVRVIRRPGPHRGRRGALHVGWNDRRSARRERRSRVQ